MSNIWQFLMNHQVLATASAGYIWSAVIGALDAPTAQSGPVYRFLFQFLNILAANVARGAKPPRIEESPNWVDAVTKVAPAPKR